MIEGPVPPQKKKRFCLLSPLSHPSFPLISISTPHLLRDTPLPPSANQLPLASGGQGLGRCGWRFQLFISPDEYISIGSLGEKGRAATWRFTFRQGGPDRNTETCVRKPLGEGERSEQMSRQGGFTYRTPDLGGPETRGRSEPCVS